LAAGYEYLSGNSYNKTDKVYAFEPFYGTNHKFNGFMDYFYVGNHINSVGLHDAWLKYGYKQKGNSMPICTILPLPERSLRMLKTTWEPNWIWEFHGQCSPWQQ
jgi:hypothetical protein